MSMPRFMLNWMVAGWLILVAGAISACGGGGTVVVTPDMASIPDLTAAPSDMPALDMTAPLNCSKLIFCLQACKPANAACVPNCMAAATANANKLFNAFYKCANDICMKANTADGGGMACTSTIDGSMPCSDCISSQQNACGTELGACFND